MLQAMQRLAKWLATALRRCMPELSPLVAGFHAVPSMRQLHLHLISLDFDSDALKNKKHFNSFTTDFLVPPWKWLESLERQGAVMCSESAGAVEAKLKAEMRCPLTGNLLKNMPAVKAWLSSRSFADALQHAAACLDGCDLVTSSWPLYGRAA